jgi:hypothetical protein
MPITLFHMVWSCVRLMLLIGNKVYSGSIRPTPPLLRLYTTDNRGKKRGENNVSIQV